MNTERAALAATAGIVASLLALVSGVIWVFVATITGFGFFSTPQGPSAATLLLEYVVAPVLLAVAGALPARALGVRWRPASLIAGIVSFIVSFVSITFGLTAEALLFGITTAPGSVALAASVRIGGDPAAIPALVVVTGVLVLLGGAMISAEAFSIAALVSLASWVILPAIAGLFQRRRGREEESS